MDHKRGHEAQPGHHGNGENRSVEAMHAFKYPLRSVYANVLPRDRRGAVFPFAVERRRVFFMSPLRGRFAREDMGLRAGQYG